MSKYVIINAEAIQRRIEELENNIKNIRETGGYDFKSEDKLEELKQILSQSTPLIPEIEKGIQFGCLMDKRMSEINKQVKDYISNLKFNI